MKDKILYLVLGILIGAVITAGCFLVFSKQSHPDMPDDMRQTMREDMKDFDDENAPKGRRDQSSNTIENAETTETVE